MYIFLIYVIHSLQNTLSIVWMGDSGVTCQIQPYLGDQGQCQELNHVDTM